MSDPHQWPLEEIALDEAIRQAQLDLPSRPLTELPSTANTLAVISDILSLPAGADVTASAEELRLFGKVCCLMSLRNPKWRSTAYATLPAGDGPDSAIRAQRLVFRIAAPAGSSEYERLVVSHNGLVEMLYRCVPKSEQIAFQRLLSLCNTSEGIAKVPASGLLPAFDASAWFALRACQDDIYALANSIPGFVRRSHGLTQDQLEDIGVANRLDSLKRAVKTLPWRSLPVGEDPAQGSLFSRLLLHVGLNRFILIESAMDRLAQTSADLQGNLLKALSGAGHSSISEIIKRFSNSSSVDYQGMASYALQNSIESTAKRITPGLAKVIDAQADAIIDSCERGEFGGDTISPTLRHDPISTKAVAWLLLSWAALHETNIFNEDPTVHSKHVRLLSQRSIPETHGQGMLLRRKIVSSILVSRQMQEISFSRWRRQTHFAQSVRLICREALQTTFKVASLKEWQSIFDHFRISQVLAKQQEE